MSQDEMNYGEEGEDALELRNDVVDYYQLHQRYVQLHESLVHARGKAFFIVHPYWLRQRKGKPGYNEYDNVDISRLEQSWDRIIKLLAFEGPPVFILEARKYVQKTQDWIGNLLKAEQENRINNYLRYYKKTKPLVTIIPTFTHRGMPIDPKNDDREDLDSILRVPQLGENNWKFVLQDLRRIGLSHGVIGGMFLDYGKVSYYDTSEDEGTQAVATRIGSLDKLDEDQYDQCVADVMRALKDNNVQYTLSQFTYPVNDIELRRLLIRRDVNRKVLDR